MKRLTRAGTAEPVSPDQNLRREREQGKNCFPCSTDQEQDRQPYPVDPYSAICDLPYILCCLLERDDFFTMEKYAPQSVTTVVVYFPTIQQRILQGYSNTVAQSCASTTAVLVAFNSTAASHF